MLLSRCMQMHSGLDLIGNNCYRGIRMMVVQQHTGHGQQTHGRGLQRRGWVLGGEEGGVREMVAQAKPPPLNQKDSATGN